jgi:hypothetical protein
MKLTTMVAQFTLALSLAVGVEAATVSTTLQGNPALATPAQQSASLFTPAVVEPNGFIAVCSATNVDAVERDLAARIIDARGIEVTQTNTCGARQAPGTTCQATAHFANNSALRCVVSTSGATANLRGSMSTSAGPFPFTSAASTTVAAQ